MPSHSSLRKSAATLLMTLLVLFVAGATEVRAQNAWEQAIAALQAQIDRNTATITQLQSALAAEAATRQKADGDTLTIATQSSTAVTAEAAAREAAVDSVQGGLKAEV